MTQHGQVAETGWIWRTPATGDGPWTFQMAFSAKGGQQSCPGRAATRMAKRVHFLHRHVLDTLVILEEGNLSHPHCTQCDMLIPRWALNGRHPATDQCTRGAERKRRRLEEAELMESLQRAFKAYEEPL